MDDSQTIQEKTPLMGPEARQRGAELSLRRLHPPLKVPGYEQEQFVGRGAFGEVWSAINCNSGRRVAIKFYSRRGGLDWSNMVREVEKLRFLFTDRYVVQLLEVGWDADPPYFVMEYMPFGSLADLLHQGALPLGEAVRLFREIALGMVHAHGKGVLHCDLKPSNIMLDQDGKPRLADFGQSRLSHEQAPSLGTFFYMAPEQADPQAVPDVRWDVYALGAILYQLVVGKAPYLSDSSLSELSSRESIETRLEAYRHHLRTAPKPTEHRRVPHIDSALVSIIDHCLATNPKHRYANVQAVLDALALRETRRSQRPLLLLGALAPAAVVLVMAAIALWLVKATLATGESQLVDRTLESNSFAAHFVASRFGLEIDKRWRILEREANDRTLTSAMEQLEPSMDKDEVYQRLQKWLEKRHQSWNTQFFRATAVPAWYVIDHKGYLQAISPPNPSMIGQYFGYRDYFHGGGHDLAPSDDPPPPIATAHRSNIYLSKPREMLSVAFSAPIHDSAAHDHRPLGVLVMEADLGRFAEFVGARHQFATLVDLRPDETGTRGLLIEHPGLDDEDPEFRRHYLDASMVAELEKLRQRHLPTRADNRMDQDDDIPQERGDGQFDSYQDPFEPSVPQVWLCSAQPVFIARGHGQEYDSGWTILIQEPRRAVLAPLQRLWRLVLVGGLIALALVVLILTALWGYVLLRLNAPDSPRRFLLHLAGMAESSTSSTNTGTGSSAAMSAKH